MTTLRFGTDTGCRCWPRVDRNHFGGKGTLTVSDIRPRRVVRACVLDSGRFTSACWGGLEGIGRHSDEVGDLREAGMGLRSHPQARSDRDPGVPLNGFALLLRERVEVAREAHEGRTRVQRSGWQASEGNKARRASASPGI
jgi:hypothetical protein